MNKLSILLFVAAVVLTTPSPAEPAVLEVAPPGGIGALGDVYPTIQAAIDDADPGDTITVAPATYEEDLVIHVQNLILTSSGGVAVTIIKGVINVDAAQWPLAVPNIKINADGVEVSGFTIRGPDPVAGKYSSGMLIASDNVEIHDNIFQPTNASSLDDISQAITTYRDGNEGAGDLNGLNIHDNTFEPWGTGTHGYEAIFINHTPSDPTPAGTVTIKDNVISGEVIRGITTERSNVNITGNTVETNLDPFDGSVGSFQGILIQDFSARDQQDVNVANNTVQGASGFSQGIRVGASGGQTLSNILIQNNTILSNDIGVQVRASADAVLVNYNQIAGNSTYGIQNTDAAILDATLNCWADATGPYHALINATGAGDEVSDNVDFYPWYIDCTFTVLVDLPVHNVTQDIYYYNIQSAIDAATANDHIVVAAGTFVEQLEITIPLTITGSGQGTTIIQSPDTLTLFFVASSKDNYPIVYLHDVSGVVIEELTVDGAGKGNANYRFQGIGLRNAGATVQNVTLINVMDTPFSGAQHGVALYVLNTDGTDRDVNVLGCIFTDYQKNAMAINGENAIARVENCTTIGAGDTTVTAQNGIQFGSASGIIKNNTVKDMRYTGSGWSASGILGYGAGGPESITIEDNTVENCQGAIQVYYYNGDVNVADNNCADNDFSFLFAFDSGSVTSNNFNNCGEGLYLADVTDITLNGNTFNDCNTGMVIDGASDSVTATDCEFKNNDTGIAVVPYETDNPDNVKIECSKIAGNSDIGIQNDSSNEVDAQNNFWGDASGPSGAGGGSGDAVSANVDFFPWLLSTDCEDATEVVADYVVDDDWTGLPDWSTVMVDSTAYFIGLNAFDNIQDAINAAADGNSISVADGNYDPFIIDGRNDLTISAGSNPVVQGVQSVATAYSARDCVVFVKDSTNIVLNELDIQGAGLGTIDAKNYGVIWQNSTGTINSCTISPNTSGDMSSTALGIWDGSVMNVEGSLLENFGRIGILVYNGTTVEILENEIAGQVYNGEGQVNYGIEVEGMSGTDDPATASQAIIRRNEIYNCDNTFDPEPTWGSAGVYVNGWLAYGVEADSIVTVEDNFIHDNFDGAYIAKSSASSVRFNTIVNNRNIGVVSGAASDDSTVDLDATYNFWGHASGPQDPNGTQETDGTLCQDVDVIKNADGLGDKVSEENAEYCPWLIMPLPGSTFPCPVGDLDGDCDVDFFDFARMAANWLEGTGP